MSGVRSRFLTPWWPGSSTASRNADHSSPRLLLTCHRFRRRFWFMIKLRKIPVLGCNVLHVICRCFNMFACHSSVPSSWWEPLGQTLSLKVMRNAGGLRSFFGFPQKLKENGNILWNVMSMLFFRDLVDEAKNYLLLPQERPLMQGPRTRPRKPIRCGEVLFAGRHDKKNLPVCQI